MEIEFYSEEGKFDDAMKDYRRIWNENGERIVGTIERISGLKFKTEKLEAEVFEGVSSSHPLRLRSSYPSEVKRATLIHELCHILLSDNNLKFDSSEEIHRQINPVLYKTWLELCGKDFADRMVEVEKSRGEIYKKSW